MALRESAVPFGAPAPVAASAVFPATPEPMVAAVQAVAVEATAEEPVPVAPPPPPPAAPAAVAAPVVDAMGGSTGSYVDENPFAPEDDSWRGGAPAASTAAPAPEPVVVPSTVRATETATASEDARPSPAPAAAAGDAGPVDGARLRRAWTTMLQDGDGVPPGMAFILKGAKLSPGEGRQVRLEMPAGSPALERLANPATRRGLEDALGRRLGGPVTLVTAAGQAAVVDRNSSRITAESARKARLDRLMEGEPLLSAAVTAWDLELVD